MSTERPDLVKGTLDLLILAAIADEPMHGWGITQRIEERSRDVLNVNQGSLYPALARLGRRGWIRSTWGTTENNRRARYYQLTAEGRRRLTDEKRHWRRASQAVDWVVDWSPALEGGAS